MKDLIINHIASILDELHYKKYNSSILTNSDVFFQKKVTTTKWIRYFININGYFIENKIRLEYSVQFNKNENIYNINIFNNFDYIDNTPKKLIIHNVEKIENEINEMFLNLWFEYYEKY